MPNFIVNVGVDAVAPGYTRVIGQDWRWVELRAYDGLYPWP
jgi:hypothetical protein